MPGQPRAPLQPGVPVAGIPVQPGRPAQPGVPVQARPGVPVAARPAPGVPVAPGTMVPPGYSAAPMPVGARRKRYRKSPFLNAISHPLVILGVIVLVVAGLAGTAIYFSKDIAKWFGGKPIPGDEAISELIDRLHELADILADVNNPRTYRDAQPRLQSWAARMAEWAPKVQELRQVTPDQQEHLRKKYETRLKEAYERAVAQQNRLASLSGFPPGTFGRPIVLPPMLAWDRPLVSEDYSYNTGPFASGPTPVQPAATLESQYGADKVAQVEVLGVPADQRGFVVERLREASAGATVQTTPGGGDLVAAKLAPVADLQGLAAKINLGTTSVDPAKRKISVQADLARFPQPLPPEATNPAHEDYYKANLAELSCPDANRRREAAERLKNAEPRELKEEIAKGLLGLMADNNAATRRSAMEAWAVWRTTATATQAVKILLTLTRDPDAVVRGSAFRALGDVKDPATVEPMIRLLGDADSRNEATQCLTAMGSVAEKGVLQCLSDPSAEVRTQAWRILEQIATKQSVPALVQLLDQQNKDVCQQVLPILARLKDERAMPAAGELLGHKELRHAAVRFFEEMGPAAEKTMIACAKHADENVVAAAIEVLEKIGTAECVPVVLEVAAGDNFFARINAFRILERLKDPRSIVPLVEMLGNHMQRHSASQVLKKMGPAAEDVAIKGLKHPNKDVGMACLEILQEIGTEKSLKEIQPYTRVRDGFVRMAAARAMDAIASRTQANPFKKPEEEEEK